MSNPLRILEDQSRKNAMKVGLIGTYEPGIITSDSAGWIYGKTYTGNAYRKEQGRIVRSQSRLNIGSLSIKFFKKRPGPIRRALIKWLLGWTWDELTQEKEEDQVGPAEQGILSTRISHLPMPPSAVKNSTSRSSSTPKKGTGYYYYQGNSGSITFGDRNRDIDRDIALNA